MTGLGVDMQRGSYALRGRTEVRADGLASGDTTLTRMLLSVTAVERRCVEEV